MRRDEDLPGLMASRLSDDGIAIFLFHGVITRQRHRVRNYTGKHLLLDPFALCMKRMAQEGRPLSMDDVLAHCDSGEPFPPRAFAITFDDGFENNLSVAAPVLANLGIPMMIYATSGFVEHNGMSWIDRIEYAVEDAPAQSLAVDWVESAFPLSDAASRIEFLKAVRRYVKNDPRCDANAFADALCERLGKPGRLSSDDPLDLKMSWQQIRAAHEGGLVSFGGHSHTHPILSFLSSERLAEELDSSLGLLQSRSGIGPTHFSYPEGLEHCYSQNVIDELRSRDVRCSPTAIDGINAAGADPFHLRRIMVA